MEATLEEVLDWAEEMERLRAALEIERGEFPGPSALCKSFDRAPMHIWRELLRRESELLEQSGHAAIDATYFDRRQASNAVTENFIVCLLLFPRHIRSKQMSQLTSFARYR